MDGSVDVSAPVIFSMWESILGKWTPKVVMHEVAKQQMWENGSVDVNISQDDLYVFLFGSGLRSFVQVICFSQRIGLL